MGRRRRQTCCVLLCLLSLTWAAQHQPLGDDASHSPSICLGRCREFGTCNEELGRCDCPKNRTGDDCSQTLEARAQDIRCRVALYPDTNECITFPQSCMNACNRRGRCISGFCHCEPGYYGADCSLSLGPDGKPVLLAGTTYKTRNKRPHVYVYELPPHLTSWVNARRLDRPTHNLFTQRLLSSGARTADGDAAYWYFIPVRCRGHGDGHLLKEAVLYIQRTWPWWNRLEGRRHIIIHTGDLGVDDSPSELRDLTLNSTWLTHWGLYRDRSRCCGWRDAHRPGKDVVIPVYISTGSFRKFGFTKSPLHPAHTRKAERTQKFFFAGRICGDRKEPVVGVWPNCNEGHDYSANVRQRVHFEHHNRSGYLVITRSNHYDKQLRSSRFCLAPLGGGHGQRQIIVAAMGCIPVTIGDYVDQPFEPHLNWSAFSVPVLEKDIPVLHERLAAIEARPGMLESMQRALGCASQHMIYSSITGGFLGEQGKYDAFESTLEVLRVMAQNPEADPSTYEDIDPDFARFMNCGADGRLGDIVALESGAASPSAFEKEDSSNMAGGDQGEAEGEAGTEDQERRVRRSSSNLRHAAFYKTSLCSNSWFDAERQGHEAKRPPCYDCLLGASNTHGLPGGAICCGSEGDLSTCLRNWD